MILEPPPGIPKDVRERWKWASEYEREMVGKAISEMFARVSSLKSDQAGVDWHVSSNKADVMCRLRRVVVAGKHRDFTVRAWARTGRKTEFDKIMSGVGDYYVYGWVDKKGAIEEYVVVSLEAFRAFVKSLQILPPVTKNRDGNTGFRPFRLDDIWRHGGIVCGAKDMGPLHYDWLPCPDEKRIDLNAGVNVEACPSCGSVHAMDFKIHGGRSVRRDCIQCGRTIGFPVWNGS